MWGSAASSILTKLEIQQKNLPIIDMQSKKYLARAVCLKVELAAAKKNWERNKSELFTVQVETSVLKKKNLQIAQDLKQQIELREEEVASKEESITVIDEMIIQKGSLVQENKESMMNKMPNFPTDLSLAAVAPKPHNFRY